MTTEIGVPAAGGVGWGSRGPDFRPPPPGLGPAMSAGEAARLLDAVYFAALKHSAQRRKDPERTPYINHPIGVAQILAQEAGVTDVAVLQAALLHDTVEDTDATFAEIQQRFGSEVRRLVEELTDDKALPQAERKRLQVERAAGLSASARLVALADKLHNLRDLDRRAPEGWSEQRVREYFAWAARVANALRGSCPALEEPLWRLLAVRGVAP